MRTVQMPWGLAMEEKRKRKKRRQLAALKEEEIESEKFSELLTTLGEMEREEKYVDVQICPQCKSPRVRRVGTMNGDMSGHVGITPVKFECLDCGWRERLVLKATNRPMGVKDVAIIAEALALKKEKMDN